MRCYTKAIVVHNMTANYLKHNKLKFIYWRQILKLIYFQQCVFCKEESFGKQTIAISQKTLNNRFVCEKVFLNVVVEFCGGCGGTNYISNI